MGNKSTISAKQILKTLTQDQKDLIEAKFTENELKMLYLIFKDLAMSEKSNDVISKAAFNKFFTLPGVLGERLYTYFNGSAMAGINFTSFISSIANISRPDGDEHMQALFEVFDTDNDGFFGVDDLVTVIRSLDKTGIIPDLNKMKSRTFEKKAKSSDSSTSDSSRSIPSEDSFEDLSEECQIQLTYVSSERVLKLAKRLIKKAGFYTESKLDFEQFNTFISKNEYFYKVFADCFRSDLWSDNKVSMKHSDGSSMSLVSVCKPLSLSDKAIPEESIVTALTEKDYTGSEIKLFTSSVKSEIEGYLKIKGRKSGAMKKRYYFIKGSLLYYYEKVTDQTPKDVTYLPNKLFKKESIKGKFCISVYTYDQGYHYKTLYADSEEQRDMWYNALLAGGNNRDVLTDYKMRETLGVGKFATVRKAYDINDSNKTAAIKIISKKHLSETDREYIMNELNVLSLVNHPSVPKFFGVHETPDKIYIAMEEIKGGELFEYLVESTRLPEEESTRITYKLLKAVKYLHELKIMHRDIKTENMLITRNRKGLSKKVYLIDFGLAKFVDSRTEVNAKLGTLGYCAPEVILKDAYNESVDIWGVGMVYYLLLAGRLPFDSKSNSEIAEKTVKEELPTNTELFENMDSHVPKFLQMACQKSASDRLNIDECLAHSVFAN